MKKDPYADYNALTKERRAMLGRVFESFSCDEQEIEFISLMATVERLEREAQGQVFVVFAVVYSNYEPAEVDSLHLKQENAQKRADELNSAKDATGMWGISAWEVEP